ncbi:MAG: dephospho-CoA kinase [Gracilibacter sp. BRH_c7a]|nr:MAG: dephospho-CoA kinase [Gracilibacter sp. BRH_c7a]
MLKIGLTGGIASGKTSVANWFADRGIRVFDADKAVHDLYSQEGIISSIAKVFGAEYIQEGFVNRSHLGRLVFSNKEARTKLEEIIHPYVREEMRKSIKTAEREGEKTIILDLPLLFETDWTSYIDEIWTVYVPLEIQIQRLTQRNGFSREEATQRISSQLSLEYKADKADRVIDNSGDWPHTELELVKIWEEINQG